MRTTRKPAFSTSSVDACPVKSKSLKQEPLPQPMQSRTDWRALARIAINSPPERGCKALHAASHAGGMRKLGSESDSCELLAFRAGVVAINRCLRHRLPHLTELGGSPSRGSVLRVPCA